QQVPRGIQRHPAALENSCGRRGVERRHVHAPVLGLRAVLVVEKMSAVWQELRPVLLSDSLVTVELRYRRHDTARSRDSGNRAVRLAEHDDVIRVPGTAAAGYGVTEHLWPPAGRI